MAVVVGVEVRSGKGDTTEIHGHVILTWTSTIVVGSPMGLHLRR